MPFQIHDVYIYATKFCILYMESVRGDKHGCMHINVNPENDLHNCCKVLTVLGSWRVC